MSPFKLSMLSRTAFRYPDTRFEATKLSRSEFLLSDSLRGANEFLPTSWTTDRLDFLPGDRGERVDGRVQGAQGSGEEAGDEQT